MLTQEKKTSQAALGSPYQCDECTQSKGRPITFSSRKDLHRHLTRTVTHNAPPARVARCSCGKIVVTRKHATRMHRRFCRRNTEGLGHGSIDGSRNATDVGIGTIVGEVTVRKLFLYVADFNTCFFRLSAHFGQYCKQVCGVAYMAYSVSSDERSA